jgi:anti-sigma factor RsiW
VRRRLRKGKKMRGDCRRETREQRAFGVPTQAMVQRRKRHVPKQHEPVFRSRGELPTTFNLHSNLPRQTATSRARLGRAPL